MEGIIIALIIIIIAFNLLYALFKTIRGERGGQTKNSPTGRKHPAVSEAEAEGLWEEATNRHRAKKPEEAPADQENNNEKHKGYKDLADDCAIPPPGESGSSSEAASNLMMLPGHKESLVAAVIVHEILKDPPGMRRRK